MATEHEKQEHAMEFFRWILRNPGFLDDMTDGTVGRSVPDFLEFLQELYNNGYDEACILCLLMAKNERYVDQVLCDIMDQLICARWRSWGSKRMLEDLLARLQAAWNQHREQSQRISVCTN